VSAPSSTGNRFLGQLFAEAIGVALATQACSPRRSAKSADACAPKAGLVTIAGKDSQTAPPATSASIRKQAGWS
jgi:hypothetical protein